MLALENADEILQILDRFTKQKSKDIPPELEEYINYVAKSGDTVYRWPTVQYLFREKLRNVIKDFHDTTASIEDLPQCPNVDQFNYESMKTLLFERFDNFQAAPFTIQRLCELLTDPKKHYSRLDKFMRALEKNILVVSTVLPGRKPTEDIHDSLPEINIDGDIIKNDEKRYNNENHSDQNGPTENHNEVNSKEHTAIEVTPSSSTSSASSENDVKTEEDEEEEDAHADEPMAEKPIETEKPAIDAEHPAAEIKEEENKASDSAEIKPADTVEVAAKALTEKMESDSEPKVDDDDKKVDSVKADTTETKQNVVEPEEQNGGSAPSEEKKVDEEKKETPPIDEPVASERPPTPKRACSSDDEDDDAENSSKNHNAKKIRLELDDGDKVESKPDSEQPANEPIVKEPELQKETDILDAIESKIDAQTEKELLDDVVDSALAATEDSIKTDAAPSDANEIVSETTKVAEEAPTSDDLLKSDEPVATIPADLDFTPDEALSELVSSDILAVIPEQPAEEVKMSEEPANVAEPVAAADEMTVENTEANTLEAENAMESAPIKADEEQMDVDESNSVDAMDL